MKFKQIYLFIPFLLLIVISTNAIEVNAMNTELSTEELSEEAKTTFVSSINIGNFLKKVFIR